MSGGGVFELAGLAGISGVNQSYQAEVRKQATAKSWRQMEVTTESADSVDAGG